MNRWENECENIRARWYGNYDHSDAERAMFCSLQEVSEDIDSLERHKMALAEEIAHLNAAIRSIDETLTDQNTTFDTLKRILEQSL